jgi:thioredoxin 1
MNNAVNVDDNNFENEVLKSELPVLVKFGADWCRPCARLEIILNKMFADGKNNHIKLANIDIDDASKITSKFGIKSVPTIFLFKDGEVLFQKAGVYSEMDLSSFISEALSSEE